MDWFIIIAIVSFVLYMTVKKAAGHVTTDPECEHCKDTGEIEVLVMGTDTDWVDCICQDPVKTKRRQKLDYLLNRLNS